MQKITIFIGSLNGGGAERVVCNLANHLSEKGHDISIITMEDSSSSYTLNNSVVHFPLLRSQERKNFIWNVLIRVFRLKKYLLANSENNRTYIVFLPTTTLLLLLLKGRSKSSFIASERGNPASYPKKLQFLLKMFATRADAYVFQTEEIRDWYGNSVKEEKAYLIPNAINSEFLRPEYMGKRDNNIVAVGRLSKAKNFSLLIDAFSMIEAQFPDNNLVIYGEGPLRSKLEQQIEEYNLKNRVILAGYQDNIPERIEKAAVFVLSSDNEGMPNALLEAMALGVPCIATDCAGGGARELIDNMENGILVNRGSKEELAHAIKVLLEDKDLRDFLGRNGRQRARILSPDIIYNKWESVITEINSKA